MESGIALPDAARHDRQNDKEEDLERLEAQRQPNTHADNHADDFTAQHREEDAQEARISTVRFILMMLPTIMQQI